MRSAPARSWSSTARRTASRTASSRSSGPNSSGWRAASSQNLAYQPGNDQLPMTVAGSSGSEVTKSSEERATVLVAALSLALEDEFLKGVAGRWDQAAVAPCGEDDLADVKIPA